MGRRNSGDESEYGARGNAARMEPRQWFDWFMRNHNHGPLIEAGLWKKPAFIRDDLSEDDLAALHAAYLTGGYAAVWPVLVELLKRTDAPIALPSDVELLVDGSPRGGKSQFIGKWASDAKAVNRVLSELINSVSRRR